LVYFPIRQIHPPVATSLRISRSFALSLTAFSLPMRIMIFWPAERASSAGSANS
jgi:hypothetical protein